MNFLSRATACVAVLLALAACASPGKPADSRSATSSSSSATRYDADALAAAALGTWATQRDASRALGLIRQATDLEPNRPDLAWLHIRLCMELPGCEPEPLEARLRKLDPANGVVWVGLLARAQARRDTRAEQSLLEAMSQAQHFNVYWTTLEWRLATALALANKDASPPNTPLTTALNDVTGWLSRISIPAFKPVTAACDHNRASDPQVRTRCARTAEAMQRSDTTLVEGLGLGIAQRLTTPGSASAMTLDDRVENLSYVNQTAGSIIQAQVEREKFSEQLIELMRKLPREQDVFAAILRWAGRPLTAPPDL
jgi:hypothetical protein